jgi:hypothetical protein
MRRCIAGLTSLLIVLGAMQVQASNLETFYPERTLTFWQSRYPDNVRWNFDNLLIKNLTAGERQAIGSVALQFPLIAPGQTKLESSGVWRGDAQGAKAIHLLCDGINIVFTADPTSLMVYGFLIH